MENQISKIKPADRLASVSEYYFSKKLKEVARMNAEGKDVISLGIGDVTRPLPPAVITALHTAVDEMASSASFKGYGPEQGYEFLRHAIAENDFRARGVEIAEDEI